MRASLRLGVAALAAGIAAMILWLRAHAPPPLVPPGPAAEVYTAANAPASRLRLDALTLAATGSALSEARAPGRPLDAAPAAPSTSAVMTEEARSARNEELIAGLEKEKSRMGIAQILLKDGSLSEPPGVVLRDADSLAEAWSAAGLPGRPPRIDFKRRMVVFLTVPGRITAVKNVDGELEVRYRLSPRAKPVSHLKILLKSSRSVVFIDEAPASLSTSSRR
ncbi:MAG: hypothetical protein HY552_01235 [Elusimicrobia bacterium]|nr:hypothetical protein [Elusimicrobiota bacterium]